MTAWLTAAEIAERHGAPATQVEGVISLLGVRYSKAHARRRASASEREYSPGLVLIIEKELAAQKREERG